MDRNYLKKYDIMFKTFPTDVLSVETTINTET